MDCCATLARIMFRPIASVHGSCSHCVVCMRASVHGIETVHVGARAKALQYMDADVCAPCHAHAGDLLVKRCRIRGVLPDARLHHGGILHRRLGS